MQPLSVKGRAEGGFSKRQNSGGMLVGAADDFDHKAARRKCWPRIAAMGLRLREAAGDHSHLRFANAEVV
jgi:hypothetical protein